MELGDAEQFHQGAKKLGTLGPPPPFEILEFASIKLQPNEIRNIGIGDDAMNNDFHYNLKGSKLKVETVPQSGIYRSQDPCMMHFD